MVSWKERKETNKMEYVYIMQASEEQYKKMMKLLDLTVKKDGLSCLQDVVDIYNVLVSSQKIPTTQYEPSETVEQTTPQSENTDSVKNTEEALLNL